MKKLDIPGQTENDRICLQTCLPNKTKRRPLGWKERELEDTSILHEEIKSRGKDHYAVMETGWMCKHVGDAALRVATRGLREEKALVERSNTVKAKLT